MRRDPPASGFRDMGQARERMGHFTRDIGKQLEDATATKLTVLRQQGIVAWWQKNDPSYRRRGGFYQPTIASGADFSGTFMGGLSFALETKSIGVKKETGKIDEFCLEQRIPVVQLDHLNATARSGAVSILVLQFRHPNAPWALFGVPWLQVPWRKHRVRHFVTHDDLGSFRLPAHTMILDQFVAPTCITPGSGPIYVRRESL